MFAETRCKLQCNVKDLVVHKQKQFLQLSALISPPERKIYTFGFQQYL